MKWQFSQTIQPLRTWNRPSRRLVAALVIAFCLLPTTAHAVGLGDILSLLKTITSTIQDAIGGALSGIQAISADRDKFHQEVIWPVAGINRARAFVGSTIGRYQSSMWQIHTVRTNSATLTNPSQLESLMRGGQSANINQFQEKYARVYSAVPVTQAPGPFSET